MIITIVSLFILAFIQMLVLGQVSERLTRLEKVVLALTVTSKLNEIIKDDDNG